MTMPAPGIRAVLLLLALAATPAAAPAAAEATAPPQDLASLKNAYREVDLRQFVAASRTGKPGLRTIFVPARVKFRARLARPPIPQESDYLMSALQATGVVNPPTVEHGIGLDYGGEKGLAAYIEKDAARHLASAAKAGDTLTFYALHVYNNHRGPALVIVSFGQ